MQQFIANGRVSDIPEDAVGRTANGNISFKFDFACDSSLQGNDGKPLTSFTSTTVQDLSFFQFLRSEDRPLFRRYSR